MARLRRPMVPAPKPDLDVLVCPAHLLPDRELPLEERRQRSRDRETWFRVQGLTSRSGDYVRRTNAIIAGRRAAALPEPPKRPNSRELLYRDET